MNSIIAIELMCSCILLLLKESIINSINPSQIRPYLINFDFAFIKFVHFKGRLVNLMLKLLWDKLFTLVVLLLQLNVQIPQWKIISVYIGIEVFTLSELLTPKDLLFPSDSFTTLVSMTSGLPSCDFFLII
mmetsp:Transcript_6183/g.5779  ORF Transcript_6183/g.5779 Transcript_6183/m.5779 type:complete len:131 (+) Transcript_6183:358-750(+)